MDLYSVITNPELKTKYELQAIYDSCKSFYKRANVYEMQNGDKYLVSYSTVVAKIVNVKAEIFGTYSVTTLRHIRDFLRQNGFENGSKKELLEMYHADTDEYKVIDYFDVWWEGDENEGGWQVNNLAEIGRIRILDYTDYSDIIKKLKEMNFLSDKARSNSFEVYNDYHFIEFFEKKTNKPIFRLELI